METPLTNVPSISFAENPLSTTFPFESIITKFPETPPVIFSNFLLFKSFNAAAVMVSSSSITFSNLPATVSRFSPG